MKTTPSPVQNVGDVRLILKMASFSQNVMYFVNFFFGETSGFITRRLQSELQLVSQKNKQGFQMTAKMHWVDDSGLHFCLVDETVHVLLTFCYKIHILHQPTSSKFAAVNVFFLNNRLKSGNSS